MADLRPCWICLSHSQAELRHYAATFSKKAQTTFARLRYSLGGHRPSETAHHAWSLKK